MDRTQYIVTYEYTGSRYFDSPLRTRREFIRFHNAHDAHAWADAEHPELPGFKVVSIYPEKPIVTGKGSAGASERLRISDRCTDVCIVNANRNY